MASSSSAMSPVGPPPSDCNCGICTMNSKKREARFADQCVETAEVELIVAREELGKARARAEAAERNVMTLPSQAASLRREADAFTQLALRNSALWGLPPTVTPPWWENERHAVVVTLIHCFKSSSATLTVWYIGTLPCRVQKWMKILIHSSPFLAPGSFVIARVAVPARVRLHDGRLASLD